MTVGFMIRRSFLTPCFLLGATVSVFGINGQHGQMQQSFRAPWQTTATNSARGDQHQAGSHTFSSPSRSRQSDNQIHSHSLQNSQSGRHAPQSIHIRPGAIRNAQDRVGVHDFNQSLRLHRDGPWTGRGAEFRGVFAIGRQNQTAMQQAKQRIAARSAAADSDRPDRLVGRGGAGFPQQQMAGAPTGRGRPGMSSTPSVGRR